MSRVSSERSVVSNIILEEIRQLVDSLEFGNILVKVHAGRVIQIEVTEKKRFNDLWELEGGGGI